MWPYLCEGTASLKFRQFNSAVCDAFGNSFLFYGVCGGCSLFGGCRNVRVVRFDVFEYLVDGWGLFISLIWGCWP